MLRIVLIVFLTLSSSFAFAGDIHIDNISGIFSPKIPKAGAVFMKIKNTGNTADFLIGGKVDLKDGIVELHDVKDGKMFKIEKIVIPAKATVELKRGSLHVMLLDLPIELKEGEEFKLTLLFEKAGELTIPVKLKMPPRH